MLVNENEPLVSEILNRKVQGIDCTEAESAEIKGYLKENMNKPHTEFFHTVRFYFGIEYSEVWDENMTK